MTTNTFSYVRSNANVSNAATGGTAAHGAWLAASYDFDAFGREWKSVGPAADYQPFRFSTEFTDNETGMAYYGYRYYDSANGRWVNRDPIGESGGNALYAFGKNMATNASDRLGLLFDELDIDAEERNVLPSKETLKKQAARRRDENRKKISDALKKLCPKEECESGIIQRKPGSSADGSWRAHRCSYYECLQQANKLAKVITDTIYDVQIRQIDKSGELKNGGSNIGVPELGAAVGKDVGCDGLRCSGWDKVFKNRIANAFQKEQESGRLRFQVWSLSGDLAGFWRALFPNDHAWQEIKGPGHWGDEFGTSDGSIAIDAWQDNGRNPLIGDPNSQLSVKGISQATPHFPTHSIRR